MARTEVDAYARCKADKPDTACMQGLPGMRAGMGPPPPPPLSDNHPAWADEVWASPLDVRRRIFCNRSLNMSQIRAVGFDMVSPRCPCVCLLMDIM